MDFVPLVALVAMIWKLNDFLKYVTAREWRPAVTQVVAWTAGAVMVLIFRASDFAAVVMINDRGLDKYSWVTAALIGVVFTSLASVGVDFKKAIDPTDSATVPPLGGGSSKYYGDARQFRNLPGS